MLVVKIELHSARTGKVTEIGRTYIHNVRVSNKGFTSDYKVRVCRKGKFRFEEEPTRTGEVLDFPRRSYNVWRLVLRALRSAFPEERT